MPARALPPPTLGIYVQVPFCGAKCTYCNFDSGVYSRTVQASYFACLLEETRSARRWCAAGFNRINPGVQSFNDRELKAVGRRHPRQEIISAMAELLLRDHSAASLAPEASLISNEVFCEFVE